MSVRITKPAAGAELRGMVSVEAIYDGQHFEVAVCVVGGKQLGSDSSQPIAFSIDTTRVPDGATTLRVSVKRTGGRGWQKAEIPVVVKNAAPVGEWTHIANEWEGFTLAESSEVRFGKDSSWISRTLAPGTYECSYHLFGDPAVGVFKECQKRGDDDGGTDPPPPSGAFFVGDFETGSLSQFHDFHDAHLSRTPPGVVVVPRPGGGYMARINVDQRPDTSDYGDASMLWEGSGGNAYTLPYLQLGQTTWFRIDFLIPNGQDPNYPGHLNPAPGSFNTVQSWHTNPGVVPTAYSTNLGPYGGGGVGNTTDPVCLRLHVRGGPGEGIATGGTWYQTDGAAQTQANRKPLKWNHWYQSVIKLKFGADASSGHVEWYVDGVLQVSTSVATYPSGGGGLGHEAGLYRGPTKSGLEVIYIDNMLSGPSRASVGG